MPEFPKTEAEIQSLAQTILSALQDGAIAFQGAPISAADFASILDFFKSKSGEAMLARAAARRLTSEKRGGMANLKRAMKQLLRFAESKNLSKGELVRVGWNTRHARRAAEKPAQPLGLEIVKEGADWISLRWKIDRKSAGGKASFYRIMRRGADGDWHEVSSSLGTEHNLIEQPRGVDLEFCVVAVNKAGESVQSNSVHAVL